MHRHPCAVSIVNLTWVIEQLFSLEALLPLLRDREPFKRLLQYAVSRNLALRTMEELEACVTACAQDNHTSGNESKTPGDSSGPMKTPEKGTAHHAARPDYGQMDLGY